VITGSLFDARQHHSRSERLARNEANNLNTVASAKAGVQGDRTSLAPCSCQGQALGSRCRGNDGQSLICRESLRVGF